MILKRSFNHDDNGQKERLRRALLATSLPAKILALSLSHQDPAVERDGLRRHGAP